MSESAAKDGGSAAVVAEPVTQNTAPLLPEGGSDVAAPSGDSKAAGPAADPPAKAEGAPAAPVPDASSRFGGAHDPKARTVLGAQVQYGNNTINIDTKGGGPCLSFEADLRVQEILFEPEMPVDAGVVEQYSELLVQHRIVVIVHPREKRAEAVAAVRSLLRCVRKREASRRFYASKFDGIYPLQNFYASKEGWPEDFRSSLIYLLNRSTDAGAAAFFEDHEKISELRKRLESENAQFVVTVGCEGTSRIAGSLGAGHWFIGPPTPAKPPDLPVTFKGHFESTVAACAALFPGLGVTEFVSLVGMLSPAPAAKPAAPAPASVKEPDGAAPVPVEPTREERWWAGDRDRVLAELGVAFLACRDDGTVAEGSLVQGLMLVDEESRASLPGAMLTRFPILLTQHLDALTNHYFTPAASTQYQKCYLNLLFRMEALQIFRLTPEWLLQKFRAVSDETAWAVHAGRFNLLLMKATDQRGGAELVRTVLDELATANIEQERNLLGEISPQLLREALDAAVDAAEEPGQDPGVAFWSTVHNTLPQQQAGVNQLLLALRVVVTTSRAAPAAAIAAIRRMFSDEVVVATVWADAAGSQVGAMRIARHSRYALRFVLGLLIEWEPLEWIAFSQAVLDETEARVGRELATDCLWAMASIVAQLSEATLPDALYASLLSEGLRERTGRLLSRLIVVAGDFDAGFVVWLFRGLTTLLRTRGELDSKAVLDTIAALAKPLRKSLASRDRLDISRIAHDIQDRHFARRAYFNSVRRVPEAEVERAGIETMRIVIRAFSGATAKAS